MEKPKTCPYCGHYFEDNIHGIDQNDMQYDSSDGEYKHTGTCTYCKKCNPVLERMLNAKT